MASQGIQGIGRATGSFVRKLITWYASAGGFGGGSASGGTGAAVAGGASAAPASSGFFNNFGADSALSFGGLADSLLTDKIKAGAASKTSGGGGTRGGSRLGSGSASTFPSSGSRGGSALKLSPSSKKSQEELVEALMKILKGMGI